MKKYLNQLLVIAALIIVGCSDPCKDVVCGPGTCEDGTCICPDGYEGNSCETLTSEKYFGLYDITEEDCGDFAVLSIVTVNIEAKAGGGSSEVTLTLTGSSIIGSGPNSDTIDGTLINGKLEASGEYFGFVAIVNGVIDDTFTFNGVMTIQFTDCDIKMVKQ